MRHIWWISSELSSNLLIFVFTISTVSNWYFSHGYFYCFISTCFLENYIDVISYFVSLGILTCLLGNSEIYLLFLCHLEWLHCLFFKLLLVFFFFFWYDFTCLGIFGFQSQYKWEGFLKILSLLASAALYPHLTISDNEDIIDLVTKSNNSLPQILTDKL